MNQEYMKTRKILPLVLSMSLPMVISMAVNALYNIVDSYFVAKIRPSGSATIIKIAEANQDAEVFKDIAPRL